MTFPQEAQQRLLFSLAYYDYNKLLNSHAYFKLNDHSLGEDLVQNTFLKTWKYILKGGKIETMKAFLYHVLNDLVVDEYRKKKATSLDVLIDKGFEQSTDDSGHLLDSLDGKAALLSISRLPQKYQRVMNMRYIQYLSLKEMSLIIGQSKNAIAVQAHRGLEKLKLLYNNINNGHVYT